MDESYFAPLLQSKDIDLSNIIAEVSNLNEGKLLQFEERCLQSHAYLLNQVVPCVAAAINETIERNPENPYQFLCSYLLQLGQAIENERTAKEEIMRICNDLISKCELNCDQF